MLWWCGLIQHAAKQPVAHSPLSSSGMGENIKKDKSARAYGFKQGQFNKKEENKQ